MILDEIWKRALDGEEFLLFDDGTTDRILGFSTHEMMLSLCEAPEVFMDGTFSVDPRIFTKLYIFHALYKGRMIPFAYSRLPNNREETYRRTFKLITDYASSIGLRFAPKTF